jgi:ATP-dependent helicase/nuclease subunit A
MTDTLIRALPSIDIVGASAGTGKTTRLVSEFLQAVEGADGRPPVDPTRIIVCTFTNKAVDELLARIRQRLLEHEKVDAAQLVLTSYVGTVNSICGRLLKDYSIECGLSPHQDVIPEHMQNNLFGIASSSVLDAYAQRIEHIARRLSFNESARQSRFRKRTHWMDHVRTICALAGANGMTSEVLRQSAARSWKGLQQHLGAVNNQLNPEELDEVLESELEDVINQIDLSNDPTGKTAKELQNLRECFGRARSNGLTWRDWASISKLDVGKESREIVKDLISVCAYLPHHPRLHSDLKEYLAHVFECAVESIEAYQEYKKANGLVDFVDQEHLALELLDNPRVGESLRSRFDLVLIDEFQDTSPIQLAVFLKLARLVKQSIWVGDVKQAIYGFRGTDPQLMQECAKLFNRQPPLTESHRSRPELVRFVNEAFRRVFPAYGICEEDVITSPSGKRAQANQHTIELWRCEGKDLEECFCAIGSAVHEFIHGQTERTIEDPHSGILRRVRGSDIAILSRKNVHCSQIATALADVGLKVAINRDGLLDTPECLLTIATLRYLTDPSDKIALGYLVHLTQNYESSDQSSWLERWLSCGGNAEKLLQNQTNLEKARKVLARCTISDAINVAIDAGGIFEMVSGWGNVSYRLSNLDALRGLVAEYEDTCSIARTAATINGFLVYLEQLEECEQPASVDPDAVQVLTYHGAKGLEWPVVILTDLDAEAAPKVHKDLCKIHVEGSDSTFDISDPLLGRWIRYWPWPFGSLEKDQMFEPRAAASPEFQMTAKRSRAENTRLMYVGVTRARDILVLAPYTGRTLNKTGTQWLDELICDGVPVLGLPASIDDTLIMAGDTGHEIKVCCFDSSGAGSSNRQRDQVYWPQGSVIKSAQAHAPYILRPSSLAHGAVTTTKAPDVLSIGDRIVISGSVDMALLGDCVHNFLAVDGADDGRASRMEVADRIRRLWQIEQITSENMLLMSDRLIKFLEERFGRHECHRECPVTGRIGLQRLRGTIDLLVETSDSFHIIDHKTFPGAMDQWADKALSFKPQLNAYRDGLKQASAKPVVSLLIHLPIIGKVLDISTC